MHNVIILFTFVASNHKITTIMKFRKISLALALLGMSMIVHAEEKTVIIVQDPPPPIATPPALRKPNAIQMITLRIDGYKISWGSQFSFCGIELLTEDGTMVFSQPLNGMESSVTIPGTLSGTFTIVMYLGDMVYTGEIVI